MMLILPSLLDELLVFSPQEIHMVQILAGAPEKIMSNENGEEVGSIGGLDVMNTFSFICKGGSISE